MPKPAAYLRVSDPKQVEKFSLPSQARLIADYCAYQGWPEPVVYSEDGHSAFNDNPYARPVFAALLGDVVARRVDTVVVIDLDRFARNTLAALLAKQAIEDNRARIVSLNQQMDFTTPDGGLMFTMTSGFAHYYSQQLSRKVRAGNEQKRRDGLHVGGIPWAARRVAGRLELREDRADTLRLVLGLASRHGLHTTAVSLNERGIPAPRGGMWSTQAVGYMVDDGADWLLDLGGDWEPLVRAARANRRAPAVRHDRAVRMLSGLLHCCCGGRIHYSTPWTRPDGSVARSLHCRNKDRPQIVACGRRRTRAEYYEAAVSDWLLALPDLSRAVDVPDDSAAVRARLRESRRRADRDYHEKHRLTDEAYDALLAAIEAEGRALPPTPVTSKAIADGIADAQGRWEKWPPPAKNLFLRSVLLGVLINGRCVLPVAKPDVAGMIRRAA